MKITATISAWMNLEYSEVDRLQDHIKNDRHDKAVGMPVYCQFQLKGYTQIGTAEITLELFPQDVMNGNQLNALKEELQSVRAENQKRENALIDRISKLQAIGYEVEA